jgi:sugar transferase (PEP-CTERM/EpsH1 system associated)
MHVVHSFGIGGLENGLVNLINRMPPNAYRHAIVALTDIGSIAERLAVPDVPCVALEKGPGHGVRVYPRMFRLMQQWRPAIVHTRNLAALEMTVPAFLAGVPVRIHGEHGRDVSDLDGSSARYRWIRRLYRPFVHRYVALSRDLARYLTQDVGIADARVAQIYNGVDAVRFAPAEGRASLPDGPFNDPRLFVLGWVGRMAAVKDPMHLVRAFIRMRELDPSTSHARLVLVGDGALREPTRELLASAALHADVFMPGERDDVPDILRAIDCFILPSRGEGISNTILEAMATGLPVIATNVGGNAELVVDGVTGHLIPAADVDALAQAMRRVVLNPDEARAAGRSGRARVLERFSLDAMVRRYRAMYDATFESVMHGVQHPVTSTRTPKEL